MVLYMKKNVYESTINKKHMSFCHAVHTEINIIYTHKLLFLNLYKTKLAKGQKIQHNRYLLAFLIHSLLRRLACTYIVTKRECRLWNLHSFTAVFLLLIHCRCLLHLALELIS